MFRFCISLVLVSVAVLAAALGSPRPAPGEEARVDNSLIGVGDDFRVDSAVYVGNQKTPSSQSVTIFREGVVYDSMKSPPETVVFNNALRKFTLLNMTSQTRAVVTTDDVTAHVSRFQERLRSMVAQKPDPLIELLADPKFDEQFDEPSRELTLSSQLVTYRLTLSAGESEAAAGQYRDFSDWYVRLNLLLTPGALPPFGRLAVNAAVANRKTIASQVVLTMSSPKTGRRQTIRSTHQVVRQLTQTDLDRVAQINKAMSDFKPVSFEQYRKGEAK
jgi:hypothetical protein